VVSWLLDISIGPVQSFVGESRRTRDLWGSSYLLSFLSAHAMVGAERVAARAGGALHITPDDPMYRAVRDGQRNEPPRIGSAPNHFQATVTDDPRAVALAAEQALRDAWERVCDAVWDRFVASVAADDDGTREIWRRQVGSFWRVTWVAGPDGAPGLLDRRRHWRSHCPPDEPGDKCTVMPALQELSGHVRTHGRTAAERQRQFWRQLRERAGGHDLREDERLCAVALVKRLFVATGTEALGWPVDADRWPSTVWIGALPWLWREHHAGTAAGAEYAGLVRRHAENGTRQLPPALASLAPPSELGRLDANYLHRGFVADPRLCPLPQADPESAVRSELGRALDKLYQTPTPAGGAVGGPPVYYALLRADGDRLGTLAADVGRAAVGQALAEFAGGPDRPDGVEAIVHAHQGVTIYAGGDDVLAALPVPGALACADALAQRYRDVFARRELTTHLSAAVLLAHVRLPLVTALEESKRLLEDVAKRGNGRDSLAAAVLKPGSRHCEWVTHWTRTDSAGQPVRAVELLSDLAERLAPDAAAPGFSASLLYQIRAALSLLGGWPQWEPGKPGELPAGVDAVAYLRAEIRQSLASHTQLNDRDQDDPEAVLRIATDRLAPLVWTLLRRRADGAPGDQDRHLELAGPEPATGPEPISLDPLLLARFVAHGGHEEEHA
jgi:CRISPR-associated protein Cmr2